MYLLKPFCDWWNNSQKKIKLALRHMSDGSRPSFHIVSESPESWGCRFNSFVSFTDGVIGHDSWLMCLESCTITYLQGWIKQYIINVMAHYVSFMWNLKVRISWYVLVDVIFCFCPRRSVLNSEWWNDHVTNRRRGKENFLPTCVHN